MPVYFLPPNSLNLSYELVAMLRIWWRWRARAAQSRGRARARTSAEAPPSARSPGIEIRSIGHRGRQPVHHSTAQLPQHHAAIERGREPLDPRHPLAVFLRNDLHHAALEA